jgi:hypothetical protein
MNRWAWLGVVLIGCGGPTFVVQQYSGAQRPRESIAIIRVNGDRPQLLALDGEPLLVPQEGTRFHIEVLPGVHEIEVADRYVGFAGSTVRFVAEPAKVYRIVVRPMPTENGSSWRASASEVDRATDAELGAALEPNDKPVPAFAPPSVDAGARDADRESGD